MPTLKPCSGFRRVSRLCSIIVLLGAAAALPAAQPVTHMGQEVRDHIALSIRVPGTPPHCGRSQLNPNRFLPSGEMTDFVIPVGRALVVTDLRWTAFRNPFGPPLQAEKPLHLNIFYPPTDTFPVYQSSVLVTQAELDRSVVAFRVSEHLTAGLVTSAFPCFEFSQGQIEDQEKPAEGELRLYGYLIDLPPGRGR